MTDWCWWDGLMTVFNVSCCYNIIKLYYHIRLLLLHLEKELLKVFIVLIGSLREPCPILFVIMNVTTKITAVNTFTIHNLVSACLQINENRMVGPTSLSITFHVQDMTVVINRPGVAGAVLQSPPSLTVQISFEHCQSQIRRARELKFWENVHPTIYVMCHVSCVTCHKNFLFIFFEKNTKIILSFKKNLRASRWIVCY